MHTIEFDEKATYHIVWLISELKNQYDLATGIGEPKRFHLSIESILELLRDAISETLDVYLRRHETINDEWTIYYILDFRYKYKGMLAIEHLENFINSIDTDLDIYGNPDDGGHFGGKISDILTPMYKNLKEITELLISDNSL